MKRGEAGASPLFAQSPTSFPLIFIFLFLLAREWLRKEVNIVLILTTRFDPHMLGQAGSAFHVHGKQHPVPRLSLYRFGRCSHNDFITIFTFIFIFVFVLVFILFYRKGKLYIELVLSQAVRGTAGSG